MSHAQSKTARMDKRSKHGVMLNSDFHANQACGPLWILFGNVTLSYSWVLFDEVFARGSDHQRGAVELLSLGGEVVATLWLSRPDDLHQ